MNRRTRRPPLRSTVCVALITMSLAACSAAADQQKAASGGGTAGAPSKTATISVALGSDVDLLDPHSFRTDAAYVVTANVYEPLLRQTYVDKNGVLEGQPEVAPGL